jgi:hypothetical protein
MFVAFGRLRRQPSGDHVAIAPCGSARYPLRFEAQLKTLRASGSGGIDASLGFALPARHIFLRPGSWPRIVELSMDRQQDCRVSDDCGFSGGLTQSPG